MSTLYSRKSPVNACSIRQAFILPADAPFPSYARQCKSLTTAKADFPRLKTVNAQVLQQVIRKLKDLSTRIHHCHHCGSVKPRDVAAAQVISARGQRVVEMACGADAAGLRSLSLAGRR